MRRDLSHGHSPELFRGVFIGRDGSGCAVNYFM